MTAPQRGCPLCGEVNLDVWAVARDVEYESVPETFRYLRCAACDVLAIDPVPMGRLGKIYPSNYYSYEEGKPGLVPRIKARLDERLFRSVLDRIDGDTLAVLDVGGGSGWLLDVVKGLDPRVSFTQVVDVDANAGEIARRHGHAYSEGTIEQYETDRQFDLVLLLNIIEHVADPRAVLERTRRLLSPSGLALVKTPNYHSLDARLFRHRNWAGLHCPRHWVLFTKDSFDRLCGETGLDVSEFRYTQGSPFWASSLLHVLSDRGIVNVGASCPPVDHPLFGPLAGAFAAFDLVRTPLGGTPSQMFYVLGRDG